ncbi:MAG: methyltransferase domain-containing protein [Bacteroidota bacterium]
MSKFSNRSLQKELLDNSDIPTADLYQNLKELAFINTWLGGHKVTVKGLEYLNLSKQKTYTLIDIGCGGGDNLIFVAKWARKNGYTFNLLGVDLKKDCIDYAKKQCAAFSEISFIETDYRNLPQFNYSFDIALACLFTHHLSNNEISDLISWCDENAQVGFVINDLHRHWFAYYSIAWLTSLFSKSYLVKNDAKLSVLRAFGKTDWETILMQAKIKQLHITINWAWAFRWLIVGKRKA